MGLQAGETKSGVKLQLGAGGVIEVAVSEPAGEPVANAMVNVFTVRRDRHFNGFTDADGVARIRVPAGEYEVTGVLKEGHGHPTIRDEVISVEDGRTVRTSCVVRPLEAAGIVRDPTGNPLPGVKFVVLPMPRNEAVSDSFGRFKIAWDPIPLRGEDTPFILVARDVVRNLALIVDLGGELDHLDIKLKPGVTFAGTVLDQEGKPLQRARVRVQLHMSSWIMPVTPYDTILTGPDGVFEVKAIPAGRQYRVSAVADGYGRLEIPVGASDLKDGRREVGPFKLPPADQSVTGVVVDSNGEPVAGAEIFVYGDGQPDSRGIQTDAGGGFTIRVCKGVVHLDVRTRRAPVLSTFADVEAGATDVRIVVSEDGGRGQYVPRKPASLRGKLLPLLKDLGIDPPPDAEGKMLLVCFWDMGQRPSRNCVTQLAARAAQLGE
ncbi:MAG: carboxypeptidase-like regulatory domain-containing protein, partial [Phycisphaerales bacterium]